MSLNTLNERPEFISNEKLNKKIGYFSALIDELSKRKLSEKEVETINDEIQNINSISISEKDFAKALTKSQSNVLKVIEKESKLVVKNHYRNLWLVLGMSTFGVPLGVAFGISIGNLGLLGLGLPIGMAIGVGFGTTLDAKAAKEGRQLDVVLTP
ncbi:hypothetical protein [Aquiflexum gelatinilyticum]|uniref:hypothetical protein n=1 Tax=Aquiflexum gelatinilyticum TaxID=2961943 RepID=UPI0021690938|nr:hypothetical protein [Aquiflexum gelatinilyticum]MCS4433008.1 hypothetical protein [Aquiflexum gelatinilyticum]